MANGCREGEPLFSKENGLDDKYIGEMHSTFKGVIHDEHIARCDIVAISLYHGFEGSRNGAQVSGYSEALRDKPSISVSERR
jgi:hypothetical protein